MTTQSIAEERIAILFSEAEKRFDTDPSLSQRYVEIAKKVGERTQTSIPREFKKRFCSNCSNYWRPGNNCKVRINSEKRFITYKCLECGEKEKYGY